jgi:signal transduction histidine kinase
LEPLARARNGFFRARTPDEALGVLREALSIALGGVVEVFPRRAVGGVADVDAGRGGVAGGLPASLWSGEVSTTVWVGGAPAGATSCVWQPLDLSRAERVPAAVLAAVGFQTPGGPAAVLVKSAGDRPPWTLDDLTLLHECARAAEVTLATLNRQRRALESRAVGDAAAHRWAALARLSERLALSVSVEEVTRATLESVTPYLADWALLDLVTAGGELERVGRAHALPAESRRLEPLTRFPFCGTPPSGVLQWVGIEGRLVSGGDDRDLAELACDEELAALRALNPGSLGIVPLVAGNHVVGVLTLATEGCGQRYEAGDLAFFRSLADQAALAFNSARVFQAAERARMEREEVLAIVSHDLRNPLNTLRFALSILGQEGMPEERKAPQLGIMERALGQMEELVGNLLDAARLDAGQLSLSLHEQDTAAILRDVVLLASPQAERGAVRIESIGTENLPPVLADRGRLMQVFANLLDNAISFTPRGASVRLRACAADRVIHFEIEDSGPGVPPEAVGQVFDRFWQARQSGRAGAGLGLAIARGVVEIHGGEIGVRSEPGHGAVFHFSIPRALAADPTGGVPGREPILHPDDS